MCQRECTHKGSDPESRPIHSFIRNKLMVHFLEFARQGDSKAPFYGPHVNVIHLVFSSKRQIIRQYAKGKSHIAFVSPASIMTPEPQNRCRLILSHLNSSQDSSLNMAFRSMSSGTSFKKSVPWLNSFDECARQCGREVRAVCKKRHA